MFACFVMSAFFVASSVSKKLAKPPKVRICKWLYPMKIRNAPFSTANSVRPVFLSTYPPEECGLATFTKDSADAVDLVAAHNVSTVVAIKKLHSLTAKESRVVHVIDNDNRHAYRHAADFVTNGPFDVVSLQHEFGLYPDEWGARILDFVHRCEKPIVTTFHTLLTRPEAAPRRLVRELADKSDAIVVMTEIAANLLDNVYGVTSPSLQVIPHGVPVVAYDRDRAYRAELNLVGRKVICTFGLINPGKGLEKMIRAMPEIVSQCPEALYLIVGVTHPQVKLHQGEAYRGSLMELAESLGISENVRFVNEYLSLPELVRYLQCCDVFVTPYPGKDQIASGTMAYALATVGTIVSTPYLYAEEVLADGRGLLVPFGDSQAMSEATLRLLTDRDFSADMRQKAYRYAQPMFWPNVGKKYLDLFNKVVAERKPMHPPVAQMDLIDIGKCRPIELLQKEA